MLMALSKEQVKQMNREMVAWVKETLKGPHNTYLYNILLQLKNWEADRLREITL